MVGCMIQSRIATSADAHLVASPSGEQYGDLDGHLFLSEDRLQAASRLDAVEVCSPKLMGTESRGRETMTLDSTSRQ